MKKIFSISNARITATIARIVATISRITATTKSSIAKRRDVTKSTDSALGPSTTHLSTIAQLGPEVGADYTPLLRLAVKRTHPD